jgi:hypothetical protein
VCHTGAWHVALAWDHAGNLSMHMRVGERRHAWLQYLKTGNPWSYCSNYATSLSSKRKIDLVLVCCKCMLTASSEGLTTTINASKEHLYQHLQGAGRIIFSPGPDPRPGPSPWPILLVLYSQAREPSIPLSTQGRARLSLAPEQLQPRNFPTVLRQVAHMSMVMLC